VNLAADLGGAVARGEITAVYQPQVDLQTGSMVAVEALARWNHPRLGQISPATFIPVAEEHELIAGIGDFMLDESARCASAWNIGRQRIVVSVNVSAAQLRTVDFLERVAHNLEARAIPADRLAIEVTESLPLVDVPEVTALLAHLRSLGLGVSIDDFGTGYSSLARLEAIPATEIKIDRSLIQDMSRSRPVIARAIARAHELGMRVVAEGVETERQMAQARDLGCDRAQGFLLSRPRTEPDIGMLLSVS
jgi:EAL domain-containing protein (putative c-di-GMP-specific phosphodiesterase class I)